MKCLISTTFLMLLALSFGLAQTTVLKIENQTASPGSVVSVPVSIQPQNAVDLTALQFNINWDKDLLTFIGTDAYTLSGLEQSDFGTPLLSGNTGQLRLVWEDYPEFTNINEERVLFTIDFQVAENLPADLSTIDINFCESCLAVAYNNNLQAMNMDYQNGQLFMSSLPIQLLDFKAQLLEDGMVELLWSTASEKENERFEIERSGDGEDWKKMGEIEANKHGHERQNYDFLDIAPLLGENFYRLKQVDINGKFSYSPIQIVDIQQKKAIISYQNPIHNKLQLDYTAFSSYLLKMSVFDTNGQVLQYKEVMIEKGFQVIEWGMEDLPAGLYMIKLEGKDIQTIKVVKA